MEIRNLPRDILIWILILATTIGFNIRNIFGLPKVIKIPELVSHFKPIKIIGLFARNHIRYGFEHFWQMAMLCNELFSKYLILYHFNSILLLIFRFYRLFAWCSLIFGGSECQTLGSASIYLFLAVWFVLDFSWYPSPKWLVFCAVTSLEYRYVSNRDMYLCREMQQLLMDLDFYLFFYCWGEFLMCSAGVYTFLLLGKIHSNITEIRDLNLSPSKVVTFL